MHIKKTTRLFCSVIIPTIGRKELTKAVTSVLSQNIKPDYFEIIVVNDSGKLLGSESWQRDPHIRILNTQRQERCVARNAGAAIARGDYLWFLDDDDWIMPGALATMLRASQSTPEAVWIAGALLIVDGHGREIAEVNIELNGNCSGQIMGGAWIPLQSAVIKSDAFFGIGGFNPKIIGTEDQDLGRRMAMYGDFASINESVGCLLRGESWVTSTAYEQAPVDTRRSRDDVLAQPQALKRIVDSNDDPYWQGRMIKVLLSTINYNLRHRRLAIAVSRLLGLVYYAVRAWRHWFASAFWQGVHARHVPGALHFIVAQLEQDVANDTN